MVVSCRSTKKTTKSDVSISKQTEMVKTSETKENVTDNKDRVIVRKTTTTKTKYYPPEVKKDSMKPNINPKEKGSIEFVETTVVEEKEVDQGIVESRVEQKQTEVIKGKEQSEEKVKVIDEVKVPIQWKWIFGILLLVSGLVFYFKKSPFIQSIWKVIKGILKIN